MRLARTAIRSVPSQLTRIAHESRASGHDVAPPGPQMARSGGVALAVGLLVIAMLGSIAIGILVALAVLGSVVGR